MTFEKSKQLLVTSVLIVALLTGATSASVFSLHPAYAAGALTGVVASPSNNFAGKGSQWVFKFVTATTANIATIKVQYPSGFNIAQLTAPVTASGIGAYTLSVDNTNKIATWTITSPVSIPSGTTITLFATKAINTVTIGADHVVITTNDGSGVVDTGNGNL